MSTREYLNFTNVKKIFRTVPHILRREKCLDSLFAEKKILDFSKKLSCCAVARKARTTSTSHQVKESNSNKISNSVEESSLESSLTSWALQNNISTLAFSQLLKVLAKSGLKDLPKNAHVILKKKEESVKVYSLPPGKYVHLGLENNLRRVISTLSENNLLKNTNIEISIFIDHLLLSNLTKRGLWVILGSVIGYDVIFIIGGYLGFSKPKDSNLFISHFVNEAKSLCGNGLTIDNNKYSIYIKRIICDAPAKAFILNIKNFWGYSSCTKCNATGKFYNRKVSFPLVSEPLNDEHFSSLKCYNDSKTKLLEIPNFGIVSNVPLDYMHLVCLGVVKKLISIWLSKKTKYLSSKKCVSYIWEQALALNPTEFQTKLKSLGVYTRWHSTTFRQFLLYSGPVLMKGFLLQEYYENFLNLHTACRLFCLEHTQANFEIGKKLLNQFVETYKDLYGKEEVTPNVHGLYHLADDYKLHGTLDSFSAFPFELYLLRLRHQIRRSKKKKFPAAILSESHEKILTRSLQEITADNVRVKNPIKLSDDVLFEDYIQYENLATNQFSIWPQKPAEKYVLLNNGSIIEVTNILKRKREKDFRIVGKKFLSVNNFYENPIKSSLLNVFKVKNISQEVHIWPLNEIKKKCVVIPLKNNEYVMAGLLDRDF